MNTSSLSAGFVLAAGVLALTWRGNVNANQTVTEAGVPAESVEPQPMTSFAREEFGNSVMPTGRDLGPLTGARMGMLQITPVLSNMVSDYGFNDQSSIEKKITGVVSATYRIL